MSKVSKSRSTAVHVKNNPAMNRGQHENELCVLRTHSYTLPLAHPPPMPDFLTGMVGMSTHLTDRWAMGACEELRTAPCM